MYKKIYVKHNLSNKCLMYHDLPYNGDFHELDKFPI